MLILVDMDGVIANLEARFFERYKVLFPEQAHEVPRRPSNWNLVSDLPKEHAGSLDTILGEPGFFSGLDPLPGAIKAIHAMTAEGHDVVLCTSPFLISKWCESEKRHWVEEHLGESYANALVLTHDKTIVRGDVLIDDKPEIKGRLSPAWQQVLLERSYNAHYKLPMIKYDWSDWRTVLQQL